MKHLSFYTLSWSSPEKHLIQHLHSLGPLATESLQIFTPFFLTMWPKTHRPFVVVVVVVVAAAAAAAFFWELGTVVVVHFLF